MNREAREGADISQRPLDRVLRFLEGEIERAGSTSSRLPPIREIAHRLGVSPRTVQKAFHQTAKEGSIKSVTGRGSFTIPRGRKSTGLQLEIGLNIDFDHHHPVHVWANTIYGAILKASLASGREAIFTSVESALTGKRKRPVDGFILLPDATEISQRIQREQPGAPTVFLNPPVIGATADFVSPDYNRLGLLLGRTWKKCGRRRIVFMHHPDLAVSASGQLLLSGLISGLQDAYNDLDYLHLLRADSFTPEAGYEGMRDFLSQNQSPPDAVFCKGDFLALGAIKALEEAGSQVPAEVSVIGGSGLDLSETEWPQLTRCRQPFQQLGDALFEMLLTRIQREGASQPGRFLPAPFIGGATTSLAENELFFPAKVSSRSSLAAPATGP